MKCEIIPRLEDLPDPRLYLEDKSVFVIIDVLRFSTTVVYLLNAGATYLKPCSEKEEAFSFKHRHKHSLLVGEAAGQSIKGFDFNNSPSAIEGLDLSGKKVAIRTSNGTRAISMIDADKMLYVGSTINAKALGSYLREKHQTRPIYLIAVGRAGEKAIEDKVGAMMIRASCVGETLDLGTLKTFRQLIHNSPSAKRIKKTEFRKDVGKALEFNSSTVIPVLKGGVIVNGSD